jgi:putative FmdB family regulatory protein
MPTYVYHCPICSHKFESMQKIVDSPLTDCPKCGNNSLKKIISAPAFQLKGSGWYVTDFKDTHKKPASNKAKEDQSEPKSSNESTNEEKA